MAIRGVGVAFSARSGGVNHRGPHERVSVDRNDPQTEERDPTHETPPPSVWTKGGCCPPVARERGRWGACSPTAGPKGWRSPRLDRGEKRRLPRERDRPLLRGRRRWTLIGSFAFSFLRTPDRGLACLSRLASTKGCVPYTTDRRLALSPRPLPLLCPPNSRGPPEREEARREPAVSLQCSYPRRAFGRDRAPAKGSRREQTDFPSPPPSLGETRRVPVLTRESSDGPSKSGAAVTVRCGMGALRVRVCTCAGTTNKRTKRTQDATEF